MKKCKVLVIVVALITSLLIMNTDSLPAQSNTTGIIFTDVGQQNWATKFILGMNLRGVVTGYGDQTFRPNQEVTQLEAITMMVRFLGYAEVANEFYNLELSEEDLLYYYVKDIPSWGKGSVAVGYQLELIDQSSEAGFRPSDPASRAWISKLLVDGVQKRGELQQSVEVAGFTDQQDIPTWASTAIQGAVEAGIITGYSDGSFQPERPVTRAELTALMYRAEPYINEAYLNNVMTGTVEQVQGNSIILSTEGDQLKRVYFADNVVLYFEYDRIDQAQLKVGDAISGVLNGSEQLVFIDVFEGPKRTANTIAGTIYLIDFNRNLLTLEDENNNLISLRLTPTTEVEQDGLAYKREDLSIQDSVEIVVLDDQIQKIYLLDSYKTRAVGDVVSINQQRQIITVQFPDGQPVAYTLQEQIVISDLKGKKETISSIKEGEKVALLFEEGRLVALQLFTYELDQAEIVEIRNASGTISIRHHGEVHSFTFSPTVQVGIDGYLQPTVLDLSVGDRIDATIYEELVTNIKVLNRSRAYYFFDSVDLTAKAIKVLSLTDQRYYYLNYDDQTSFYKDGQRLASVVQLGDYDRIEVTFRNQEVLRVEGAMLREGEITHIDTEQRLITIKENQQDSQGKAYVYTEDVLITINNQYVSPDWLRVGDKVNFFTVKERLYELFRGN